MRQRGGNAFGLSWVTWSPDSRNEDCGDGCKHQQGQKADTGSKHDEQSRHGCECNRKSPPRLDGRERSGTSAKQSQPVTSNRMTATRWADSRKATGWRNNFDAQKPSSTSCAVLFRLLRGFASTRPIPLGNCWWINSSGFDWWGRRAVGTDSARPKSGTDRITRRAASTDGFTRHSRD